MVIDNLYVDALINATNAYEAAWALNGSGLKNTSANKHRCLTTNAMVLFDVYL